MWPKVQAGGQVLATSSSSFLAPHPRPCSDSIPEVAFPSYGLQPGHWTMVSCIQQHPAHRAVGGVPPGVPWPSVLFLPDLHHVPGIVSP